ncbi:hypothetical protein COLO4_28015 [Corchorus olitorius]|uniref:Uncharacterized protein n=1 Tax=Corchorus olitorius TaxID=93759 RepID=A0A1R3HNC9_9ROSI|nr:hypothetical protein COLO4_28015 [Corchorus olitorius]
MGLADKNARKVEDGTVSESEKLGVDVLGRRFGDKVEQVPIKKRRHMFRSPSPPPPLTPSPHLEASAQHLEFQPAAGQNSSSNSAQRQQLTETDQPTIEDFSGIEILAAAACSDGISDDVTENEGSPSVEKSMQDRIQSSGSAMASVGTTALLETACCSPKDSLNEDKTEGSSFQDDSIADLQESHGDKDNTTAEKSIPLPDDRLLWDLNLTMDDWPCDGRNVDSEKDAVDNIALTSEDLQTKKPQDVKTDDVNRVVSSEVDGVIKTSDLTNMPVGIEDMTGKKQESEGCSGSGGNRTEHVPMPPVGAESCLMSATAKTNTSSEAVNMDQCLSHLPTPGPDKSTLISEENQETSLLTHSNVGLNMEKCISEPEVSRTVCVENAQVQESDVASPYVPALEMVANDVLKTGINKDCEDHDSNSVKSLAHDLDKPRSLEPNEVGHVNGAEEMDICHSSPKSEDMSISDDCGMEAAGTDGASSAYTAQADSVADGGSEVLLQKSSRDAIGASGAAEFFARESCGIYTDGPTICLDKGKLNDPSNNESNEPVFSQDKEMTVGLGSHSELQAGYDSQFEDGELRESDVQCWEEAEQVDYDTEFEEERSYGLESESGEKKFKVEIGSSPDVTGSYKYCETGEALRENPVNLQMRTVDVSAGETKKIDCLDGSNHRDYDPRVDLPKVSKRELLARIDGSVPSDAVQRNRSDNFDGSYPRAEREVGSEKFMGRDRSASHMRGRSPAGGHYFNPSTSYWDSKRQHSPSYNGPYNLGRTRPKGVVENRGYPMTADQMPSDATAVGRRDNYIRRPVYRPVLRRRSPVERDDSYGVHTRMGTVRDTSPDLPRFRRYQQGVNRGIRDEYLRHVPDEGAEYFSRMPHRLGRRERSISPHGGRPHYTLPYKKTRSRSRSRSPTGGWLMQRDRNEASRRRSRSPDFRSDARIDRVRMPFTKRFAADYGEEFVPPARNRISPQRNSRVFDDRNAGGLDHFRGRKSPVRMFRQGQRFDQVRPVRRMNSDDYFRPMIRQRRFPDMAGGGGGGKGCKYEGSDDDKQGSRYEMMHRVRRYDTDGAVSRFRFNAEDSYVANNSLTVTNAIGVSSRRPEDATRTDSEDRSFKMQQ